MTKMLPELDSEPNTQSHSWFYNPGLDLEVWVNLKFGTKFLSLARLFNEHMEKLRQELLSGASGKGICYNMPTLSILLVCKDTSGR